MTSGNSSASQGVEDDPLTKVYGAIWSLFENSPFKPGNKVSFDKPTPVKPIVSTADMPELRIEPVGGDSTFHQTSDTTEMVREFDVMLSIGSKRLKQRFFPYNFHVFCRLASWKMKLPPLMWRDKRFVDSANVIDATDGRRDVEAGRNISQWSTLYVLSVGMKFHTIDLEGHTNV